MRPLSRSSSFVCYKPRRQFVKSKLYSEDIEREAKKDTAVAQLEVLPPRHYLSVEGGLLLVEWIPSGEHDKIYPWGVLTHMDLSNDMTIEILRRVHHDFQQGLQDRCFL